MGILDKLLGKGGDKNGLVQKASRLAEVAKLTAISTLKPMLDEYPQLAQASQLKHWNFLSTILAAHNALNSLHNYATETQAEKVKKIVLDDVSKLYPQSGRFLQDLKNFQSQAGSGAKDVGGLWLLWNLSEKKDIGNDHAIASKLNSIFSVFNTYWSADSVFQ